MPTTRSDTGSLNYNELIFAYEYVLSRFNATEAYSRAYETSSRKVASIEGCRLANSTKIRRFIDQVIMKPVYDKYRVTSQRILEELASVAFSNISDVAEIEDGRLTIHDTIENDERANAAISEINVIGGRTNLKMHDKTKALQLLGKYHGMEMEFNQIVMGLQQYGYQMIQDAETGELQLKSMRKRQIPFDIGDHVIRDVIDTDSSTVETYDEFGRIESLPEDDMGALPLVYDIPEDKAQQLAELEVQVETMKEETTKKIIRSNPYRKKK